MRERVAQAIGLLGAVFSRDTVVRAAPILILVLGLGIFGLSYVAFPADTHPAWHDATKSLGQAITVSGVVTVILNTLTFMGIFRQALHEVVTSDDFLKRRTDLNALWSRVTLLLCQGKFPALSDYLQTHILADFVPSKKDFYYADYHHEIEISWFDRANGIVSLTETIRFTLVPCATDRKISYTYMTRADSRTPPELGKVAIHHLDVDRVSHLDKVRETTFDDDMGGKGTETSYEIALEGRSSYKVGRSLTRRLHLAGDPFVKYWSDQFILNSSVRIRCEGTTLKAVFVAMGTTFQDERAGPGWTCKERPGLRFPGQGYMIFIQGA